MEEFQIAKARLKAAHDRQKQDYDALIATQDKEGDCLVQRLRELNKKKLKTVEDHRSEDVADGDLVEVNAGGEIVAAKRSTLTQLKGTRFEALFGGNWDKKLQRDRQGRIFLDVNPAGFRAIVDYLNELAISSEEDPPILPSIDGEKMSILKHQIDLFGLSIVALPYSDSNIINDAGRFTTLQNWLKDDDIEGGFNLLYRSSRDGLSSENFHSKCDNQGCTLTIIETTDGHLIGGYSNTPWTSPPSPKWYQANKSFLFVLAGGDVSSPKKMKLKDPNDTKAVLHYSGYGPIFGRGADLCVKGSILHLNLGRNYESGPPGQLTLNGSPLTSFPIKEMEVFQVAGVPSRGAIAPKIMQSQRQQVPQAEPVIRFAKDINEAINAKQESLLQAESEITYLEDGFKDGENFIANFASGEAKDVVILNVSGTVMATRRSTLQAVEDSVLAQQFDDSKWTEQGCNFQRVREWTPDDVASWVGAIDGIPQGVPEAFIENGITGRELLSLKMEALKMIGIARVGTLSLLLEEINMLKQPSFTLIEHSPYCFGKILDYLRLKQLHSQGLIAEEPDLPTVSESQRPRFEKVVKYYFPGDTAKLILG